MKILTTCLMLLLFVCQAPAQNQTIVQTNDLATLPDGGGEPISIYQATTVGMQLYSLTNGAPVTFTNGQVAVWEVFKRRDAWLMAVTNSTSVGNLITFMASVNNTTIDPGTYRYTVRVFNSDDQSNATIAVIAAGGFQVYATPYGSVPGNEATNSINITVQVGSITTGGGVTNIGSTLIGDGAANPLNVDTSVIATVQSLASYYPLNNPSNFQSGAQVVTMIGTNGFITGAEATNQFLRLSGGTQAVTGVINVGNGPLTINGYTYSIGVDTRYINFDEGSINGEMFFTQKPTIPGYLQTNSVRAGAGGGVTVSNDNGSVFIDVGAGADLSALSNAVAQAVTNNGATVNGFAISNGAVITVSGGGATGMVLIASYEADDTANTITFTNIPQTYQTLVGYITLIERPHVLPSGIDGKNQGLRINGVTNGYSYSYVRHVAGSASGLQSLDVETSILAGKIPASTNHSGYIKFMIHNYAGTGRKAADIQYMTFGSTVSVSGVPNISGSGTGGGMLNSDAPIASVTVFSFSTTNYYAGRFDLFVVTQ